jgi:DNA-binding LacI/PurR family transcriptional regulator
MDSITLLSAAEQVAGHLREALLRGALSGTIPGVRPLAADLGVNPKTVKAALSQLEQEGLLVSQGAGLPRKIVLPENHAPPVLRVGILDYEPLALTEGWMTEAQHLLLEAGHEAFFAEKSLLELRMDVKRVSRLVARTEADAWVVAAGSREVLGWFAEQKAPAFALFGRMEGLPIAGTKPDHVPAFAAATRHLVGLGHRRIALLARSERRLPDPGRAERAFLEELEVHGIRTGTYNLPDWEGSPESLHLCLESLFGATPPTALIVAEVPMFFAAQQFLGNRGLRVPQDVSLVCADAHRSFEWCRPSVAHIRWDHRPVVRRVVRWTNNVARGKDDRRQSFTKAKFVDGGTVGVAPES